MLLKRNQDVFFIFLDNNGHTRYVKILRTLLYVLHFNVLIKSLKSCHSTDIKLIIIYHATT